MEIKLKILETGQEIALNNDLYFVDLREIPCFLSLDNSKLQGIISEEDLRRLSSFHYDMQHVEDLADEFRADCDCYNCIDLHDRFIEEAKELALNEDWEDLPDLLYTLLVEYQSNLPI